MKNTAFLPVNLSGSFGAVPQPSAGQARSPQKDRAPQKTSQLQKDGAPQKT
ncbi:hypothetical protein G9Q84_27590 [Pseudomonas sp. P7]|uniref:hypothetical protein n=1 Tax=Pseudomonas sivasensis TaxID=1880678 RepID=UPI0015EB83B4|nr:hypothetical protein [Pseudomonas sivasensis]MBA2926641.1 hypothetical protein [Pseudomonas sivasensis]